MIPKIKELLIKYREIIVYLVVGVITTVVSWAAKFLFNLVFYAGTAYPTATQNFILSVVNWTAGVAAAYPMNRKWVFQSTNPKIFNELTGFVVSRVATLVLDIVMMQVLGMLGMNVYLATFISAVFVVVLNYVFSKLIIFKKQKSE